MFICRNPHQQKRQWRARRHLRHLQGHMEFLSSTTMLTMESSKQVYGWSHARHHTKPSHLLELVHTTRMEWQRGGSENFKKWPEPCWSMHSIDGPLQSQQICGHMLSGWQMMQSTWHPISSSRITWLLLNHWVHPRSPPTQSIGIILDCIKSSPTSRRHSS